MLPLDSAIRSASAGTNGVAWGVRNVAHFGRGGPGVNPIARAPRFSSEHQLFHPGFFADCSQNHPLDREKTLCFVALLVVPALDHRFRWSVVPLPMVLAGNVLVALGFYGILRVYRENTYTAATIQVEAGQTVIATGPYAIVRHPMYASALLYLVGTPLALGSYYGLLAFVAFVPVLIWRLLDEERLLARKLPGYQEYQRRVPYRLVPHVW
jgi:protein-S-isoprenylcysteine O-methyltransferase Ste14